MFKTFNSFIIFFYLLLCLLAVLLITIDLKLALILLGLLLAIFLCILFFDGKLKIYHYLYILIPFMILSPNIHLPGITTAIRLDDIWLAFGLIVFLTFVTFRTKEINIRVPKYAKLLMLFIAWIMVSIFISSYNEPYYYSHRDWSEVYKNVKLLVLLLIGLNISLEKGMQKKLINVFLVSLLISAIFGLMQYFNFMNINYILSPYYISSTKYDLDSIGRVLGTFGNPNIFAIGLLIGVALSLSEYFSTYRIKYLLILGVFFVTITMTSSRTGIIAAALLAIIMTLGILRRTKRKILSLGLFTLIPIIVLIGLQFAPDKFYYRLSFLNNLSSDTSFNTRLLNWESIFLTRTKDHLLFGTGPVSNLPITFDNEWLMLLTLYGIIGIFLFIITFGSIYLQLGKNDKNINGFYSVAVKSLILVLGISMITMPVFQQIRIMPIVILLIGLVLNKTNKVDLQMIKKA